MTTDEANKALAQPEPEGPTPIDYRRWNEAHSNDCNTWSELPAAPLTLRTTVDALAWANYCIARYARPTIQPVPVGERPWEREGWCDAEGICWWFHMANDYSNAGWIPATHEDVELVGTEFFSHSLPAHALPIPTPTPTP